MYLRHLLAIVISLKVDQGTAGVIGMTRTVPTLETRAPGLAPAGHCCHILTLSGLFGIPGKFLIWLNPSCLLACLSYRLLMRTSMRTSTRGAPSVLEYPEPLGLLEVKPQEIPLVLPPLFSSSPDNAAVPDSSYLIPEDFKSYRTF